MDTNMKKVLLISVMLISSLCITACNNNLSNNSSQTPTATDPTATQATPETTEFIGEEKAKEIALQKAGLTVENVTFTKIGLDRDDGVWQYEIEFRQDKTEYETDINAVDGTIINWEIDSK